MAAHATPPAPGGLSPTLPATTGIPTPPAATAARPGQVPAVRAVTALMGTVVTLSFLFGNVWALGTRLGVPAYVAPLVAPAVDLSVIGLMLGTRELALRGASTAQIRPARRLLIFCSFVTLALNVTEPLITGHYGRAAFDAVGPLLLIGLSDVGPGLLQAMTQTAEAAPTPPSPQPPVAAAPQPAASAETGGDAGPAEAGAVPRQRPGGPRAAGGRGRSGDLLERARAEDARHWAQHRRPISAETLRRRLHVGAATSRTLVAQVRAGTGSGAGHAPTTSAAHPAMAAGIP